MAMEMEERERLCLKTLKEFPRDDYVLIGGYASSSFEFPRFSVDLDLVIDGEKQEILEKKLKDLDFFSREGRVEPVEDVYQGKFERFEKEINELTASVDLLINPTPPTYSRCTLLTAARVPALDREIVFRNLFLIPQVFHHFRTLSCKEIEEGGPYPVFRNRDFF